MQLVLAQVSDAEALQRYEDVCKDAEETDVLPFRLQYADMSAFLKAQTDWHIGANLPEGVVSSSLYLVRQHGEVVATLVLRHELNAYLRKFIGHIGYRVHPAYRRRRGRARARRTAGWKAAFSFSLSPSNSNYLSLRSFSLTEVLPRVSMS